jgi:general secretion pathway protein A
MYEAYYGLRERPFDITPNPRFLLLTSRHKEALSTLRYGLEARKGIVVLTGEAGTGKTTLLKAVFGAVGEKVWPVSLNNPRLTRGEFFELLADGFGLGDVAHHSKARFVRDLEDALRERHRAGLQAVLIIDEAQGLSDELLEEVRLLANVETERTNLLTIVLAGQSALSERIAKPDLRQLKQRVALRCTLAPLQLQETAAYVAGRIRIAGGEPARTFSRHAVYLVHEASGGIPRLVNIICDNALLSGFAADERPVCRGLVAEVCRDLDLAGEENTSLVESPRKLLPLVPQQPDHAHDSLVTRAVDDGTKPTESEPVPELALVSDGEPRLFQRTAAPRRRFLFFF